VAELAYRTVYAMNKVEARQLLIQTYQKTDNISQTARCWHTSRQVVRRWVQRYQENGSHGLHDLSRRPNSSPRKTPPEIEQQVLQAWQKTHYGRKRLALYLRTRGLSLSPHTIRHILRRVRPPQTRKRRKILYPAHWAWEVQEPFCLLQTDTKDIHDKGSLGTQLTTHLGRHHLPRYQWTACDGRTRMRFLAYSHHLNRTNGLAFLILALLWLRACGVEQKVEFQTDWGQEFGGDNPTRIAQLAKRFLHPLGGDLRRYPLGRKGYNGRVERSHRTDDEEFYRPYLAKAKRPDDLLSLAQRWVYFYNVLRPHTGEGMNDRSPLNMLQSCGYSGDERVALLPPILLDPISTDLLLSCDPKGGNDLLAHYNDLPHK
jgi:transposase